MARAPITNETAHTNMVGSTFTRSDPTCARLRKSGPVYRSSVVIKREPATANYQFAERLTSPGFKEALQIVLVHAWLTGRHVVQLAGLHPLFKFVYQTEQVIERIDYEKQRLVMIDLERLIDRPFELNRKALHLGRFDGVRDLAIGT